MVVKLAVYTALWCYGGEAISTCGRVSKFIAHMIGEDSCDAMATTPIRDSSQKLFVFTSIVVHEFAVRQPHSQCSLGTFKKYYTSYWHNHECMMMSFLSCSSWHN